MSRAALYSFLATMIVSGNAYALDPPFDARPFNFQGPAFIGTDIRPGVLTLDFDTLITDGEGDDFALLTSSLVWGPFAEDALIQFFFSDKLQGSILTKLAPDQLFSFDLPGEDIRVVDRILVINISPDPPGFSNDAVMTIVDAGVPPREVVQVQFNIQPDECPNRIHLSNRPGIVRAAILGTDDFDVTEVAANTLELEELGPDRSFVRDVTSARKSPLDCDDEGERDGKRDLVLEFPRDRLSGLLITPPQNEVTTMKIFGFLRDGTTLMIGEDVTLLRR